MNKASEDSIQWEREIQSLFTRIYIPIVVFFFITLLLGAATFKRNSIWKDAVMLWEDGVKKSPYNERRYNNLGIAYAKIGRMDEAVGEFQRAIKANPDYALAYKNLGLAYEKKGLKKEALKKYEEALRIMPNLTEARQGIDRLRGKP